MTVRLFTFPSVLTEYNELAHLDERNGRANAVTNIMLNPNDDKDKQILQSLYKIIESYSEHKGKKLSEKEIKDTFFKVVDNPGNNFDGWYKLKVRRAFFKAKGNNGKEFWSCGNIKGVFDEATKSKSVKRDKDGKNVKVEPNYNLFLQDATGEKTECYTGRRWLFPAFNVAKASVQVVVERLGKHGIQFTLFKYRLEEKTELHSSAFKSIDTEQVDDGLDDLFNFSEEADNLFNDRTSKSNTDIVFGDDEEDDIHF